MLTASASCPMAPQIPLVFTHTDTSASIFLGYHNRAKPYLLQKRNAFRQCDITLVMFCPSFLKFPYNKSYISWKSKKNQKDLRKCLDKSKKNFGKIMLNFRTRKKGLRAPVKYRRYFTIFPAWVRQLQIFGYNER
jgi:hypothetical protein